MRVGEQKTGANVVGVDDVAFLGYRDGVVDYGAALRRDLAREIRRYRPDMLLIATYDPTQGLSPQRHRQPRRSPSRRHRHS